MALSLCMVCVLWVYLIWDDVWFVVFIEEPGGAIDEPV